MTHHEFAVDNSIGTQLRTNNAAKIAEVIIVFGIAIAIFLLLKPIAGDNLFMKLAIAWFANIVMLLLIWTGMKLRGETWKDFGLTIKAFSWKSSLRFVLLSILVFVLAMVGFVLGSIIMANITGIPESSDMTRYDYLKGNIGMLLLSLAGIYIVSSFGEEVIYRGFLVNRISQLGTDSKKMIPVAVIISSIIFGLAHFEWGAMGIVQTTLMGLALGICYVKLKKRLWILVLAHAYMDTLLMLQLYLAK